MRKSSDRKFHYRPGTSRGPVSPATFRDQMAEYARGDVLRDLRAQSRKSRENVAAEIGVTTKTLFTWEKQNGAIKWANAQKLAEFYGVDADVLVTRDLDDAAGLPSRDQLDRMEHKLDLILEALNVRDEDATGPLDAPGELGRRASGS